MFIESTNCNEIAQRIAAKAVGKTALLSMGEHTEIEVTELVEALNQQEVHFMGAIFPKVIAHNEAFEKGIVVAVIDQTNEIYTVRDISKREYTIAPYQFEETLDYSLVTFVDGLTSHISNYLGALYEKYGMKTNYFGGGAGSLSLEQQPCVFSSEGFFEDAAVYCLVPMKSAIGVKHGWNKLEGPYIVTKAEKNTVEEINWDTPFDTYKNIVETDTNTAFNDDNFFDLAKGYPLGIIKQGVDYIIRDPLTVNKEGALVCIGEVEENTLINIMKGDQTSLLQAAKDAANECLSKAQNPKNGIIIDCISRVLYLEDNFKTELENISNTIHEKYPELSMTGALTLGEISSYGNGYLEFYNKTIVVGLFE